MILLKQHRFLFLKTQKRISSIVFKVSVYSICLTYKLFQANLDEFYMRNSEAGAHRIYWKKLL